MEITTGMLSSYITLGIHGILSPDNPVLTMAYVFFVETVGRDRDPTHFRRFDDKRWYYRNDPFKNLNASQRYQQDITDKADLDALLGWHLYVSPPEFPKPDEYINPLQMYIQSHCSDSMTHGALLQKLFLNLQELLKYGPPKMPKSPNKCMDPQTLCTPDWTTFD
jgi:hypothetical protein